MLFYNGNITSLTRDGGSTISYTYSGNRLTALSGGISSSYTYDALGTKLRSVGAQAPAQIRDYVGGFEYVGGVLERIHSEEGYIGLSGSTSYSLTKIR